ncbi:GNAT family N-acetyltransferase [Listeria costaricensis]|uniref:GNAT family N-acetyltransferase n=1 Tax=Listeria costaricensis TaxID=2026604 RepID=UPI0013C45855|nr:GNAT family N-acetyltransferase [Listeria costaricensis]
MEIWLRKAEEGDVAQLLAWYLDPETMRHVGFPNGLSEEAEDILARIESGTRLMIMKGEQAIGECNYRQTETGSYAVGIKVCEADERGRGYGKTSLQLLLQAIFEAGLTEEIELTVLQENRRAIGLYEKVGFKTTDRREADFIDEEQKRHAVQHMALQKVDFWLPEDFASGGCDFIK